MAAEVRYATYGSEAYDLDRVVGGNALPEEEAFDVPSQRERINERLNERAGERAKAKEESRVFGIPLLGMVGVVVAVFLMVTVLTGYIQLAQISAETSRVRSSIADLEEKAEMLEIQYEITFNMADVESYAVNILGMARADSAGSAYSGAVMADRAQILAEDETAGIMARLTGFLKSLPEYFG